MRGRRGTLSSKLFGQHLNETLALLEGLMKPRNKVMGKIDCPSESRHHTDENDNQKWLAELADLDLGDVDTNTDDNVAQSNSIVSMASLLTRYVVNRPWIPMVAPKPLDAEQLNDETEEYRSVVEDDGHPAPPPSQPDRGKRSLLDYKDLADLLEPITSEQKPGENGVAYVTVNENILTASEISDIIADSDRRLGLAGFLPFVSEYRIPAGTLDFRRIERKTYESEGGITDQFLGYCHHWARNRPFNIYYLHFLSPLLLALQLILEVLGIQDIDAEERTQHPSVTALHFTALAAQSLTLIVQSNLRGLAVPFQFESMTSTVSDFVLEGANHSPSARKIYASSQKLSCLGDMLEKEVLVFDLKERDPQQRMDIVATPAQLAELTYGAPPSSWLGNATRRTPTPRPYWR
ncbi:hypothetical protein BJX66DRAFT_332229 [Aspergillus keveii]|uniref:Uncharacterized protein n=1 Tax=Aspergillus keveii TaxID=714993 RepID=A0ABR4GP08_9EURO